MKRTQRQREQIIQLEDERMLAKRETYLRRVNPIKQLSAAELELTIPYRRRKIWLHVVSFAAVSHRWHKQLVQAKNVVMMTKMRRTAASTIQRIWRKWKWQHASKHTVVVYTWLRKCLWKILLRVRCRRKARHATILRQFMLHHSSESHATRNFKRVMMQWRNKVIRAQRTGVAFVNCNRARLQALAIWWDKIDYERQRQDRQQNGSEDGRRLTGRKESMRSIGSPPGSAGSKRKSSISMLGNMGEKLASMQMLLTPIEIQRLQQNVIQVVKIPKSIKMRLLMEFLTNARKDFRSKQQAYKEMILCASYAREVKLEEARAIVQSSANWDGTAEINRIMTRTGSIVINKSVHPPPCFLLFSDPNGHKTMETLVRRGVQLTLDADPELKALIAHQQELRLQSPHTSPRRPSVSFSGGGIQPSIAPSASPTLSPSPRYSILKKPTQSLLSSTPAIDRPTTPSTTPN
ncbi:hypothetical protein DVH05_022381 [Phytophthora capsici]|nr:hypothetical protein DVH05_022381 [Phytophthora capsici]